jgi:hypothetical protein
VLTVTYPSASLSVSAVLRTLPGGVSSSIRAARLGRLTGRGVVHSEIVADRSHQHLAGDDPNADLHLDPVRAPELIRRASSMRPLGVGNSRSANCTTRSALTDTVPPALPVVALWDEDYH